MGPAPERTIERIARALTAEEWSGRAVAAGIVALSVVAALTVVQRALVADSAVAWVITGLHAAVVAVAVPLLSMRVVRRRREQAAQPATGVPE